MHASRDLHVQTGSKLTLSCAVQSSSAHPDYVYWYRNEDVLNYSPHVKIEDALSPDEQPLVSKLSVDNVQRSHSGNYTCAPSNAKAASVLVHVVDGKVDFRKFENQNQYLSYLWNFSHFEYNDFASFHNSSCTLFSRTIQSNIVRDPLRGSVNLFSVACCAKS